jgi:hypothetical protein
MHPLTFAGRQARSHIRKATGRGAALAAVVALAGCGGTPAARDSPWSPPLTVAAGHAQFQFGLAVSSPGAGVVVTVDQGDALGFGPARTVFTRFAQGRFHVPAPVPGYLIGDPVAMADGRVVALQSSEDKRHPLELVTVSPVGGPPLRQRLTGAKLDPGMLVARPDGRFALLWNEPDALRVATVSPAGVIGAPVTIATGNVSGAAAAFEPAGGMLVAFAQTYPRARVGVRELAAGGGLGAVRWLGPASGSTQLAAAVTPRGRAIVAWGVPGGDFPGRASFDVYAAIRETGAPAFAPAQRIEAAGTFTTIIGTGLRLAVARDGHALLAWNDANPAPNGPRPVCGARRRSAS